MSTTTPPQDPLDLDALRRRLGAAFRDLWSAVANPAGAPPDVADGSAASTDAITRQAALAAPVVWLIGKVQSGKSSIVEAMTGSTAAEVGSGFKACTATARIFDFPADAPVIRFLDTRGIGEAGYVPAPDIAIAEAQAHLLLVVMKAMDPAQDAIVAAVEAVRARHPDWPVLVAQTCLHEGYPACTGHPDHPDRVGGDLARAIAWQRGLFGKLPGRGAVAFAAIDFTREGDGFTPRLYGLDQLLEALGRVAPAAITTVLATDHAAGADALLVKARPHILGYAAAAGAVDVLPIAGAIAVPGVQAKLLHSLGAIYGLEWDRRMMAEFAGALGTGVLVRAASTFGVRQLAKLIPAYGQTAGAAAAAAMSFATTYALGHAAAYYLGRKRAGTTGTAGVLDAYQAALRSAFDLARARGLGGDKSP